MLIEKILQYERLMPLDSMKCVLVTDPFYENEDEDCYTL